MGNELRKSGAKGQGRLGRETGGGGGGGRGEGGTCKPPGPTSAL